MEMACGGERCLCCWSEPLGVAYPFAHQVSDYSVVPPLFCRAEVGAQGQWGRGVHHLVTALMDSVG